MKPINVREVLCNTPTRSSLKNWELHKCYAEFWLQPQRWFNYIGVWGGGESIQVKRVEENKFKIGCLPLMTLEEATNYIEQLLTRYCVPFITSEGSDPKHPFNYQI